MLNYNSTRFGMPSENKESCMRCPWWCRTCVTGIWNCQGGILPVRKGGVEHV